LSYQHVKAYKKAKYDQEKGGFVDVINFTNKNWSVLKSTIKESMEEFFPEMEISIDEKEKIIYTMQNQLSIGGGIFEIETLSSFEDVAQWSVVVYKSVPATRHEPEDVDEVFLGNSANNISAAKIFIDSIWNLKHEDYWENKRYELMAQEEI
jgi:hypothetical protein